MTRLRRTRAVRSGVIGVVDQVVFSVGNLCFYLVAASQNEASVFADVATGMLVYETIQLASRGLLFQSASLALPVMTASDQRRHADAFAGAVALFSAVVTVVLIASEVLITDGETQRSLILIALLTVPIMIEECARSLAFAIGRPGVALAADGVWTAVQLVGASVLLWTDRTSLPWLVGLWGGGAALGAVAGLGALGVRPRPRTVGLWLRTAAPTARGLTAENALSALQSHGMSWLILALVGPLGVGAVRAIRTLFGPANSAVAGLRAALLPVMRARAEELASSLPSTAARIGGVMAFASGLTTVVVVLLPSSAGEAILGDTFARARDLAVPFGLLTVLGSAVVASQMILLARRALARLIQLRLMLGLSTLAFVSAGAVLDDEFGAVTGAAIAVAVTIPFWIRSAASPVDGAVQPTPPRFVV